MKRKHISSVAAIILTISYTQAAPVINEISPFNAGLHPDIEGEHPDWIEIHNPDTSAVNLSGWFLTDEATALNQWAFPTGTSIPAGGYIIVFASGKTEITNELHTNFSLSGSGEYLALVQPDGSTIVDEYTQDAGEGYPPIPNHVSYGVSGAGFAFFATPTPGGANNNGLSEVISKPNFSHKRGHFTGAFDLTLTPESSGAEIRYTIDGSEPTSTTGTLYTIPFEINSTTVVRAISYQVGAVPSRIRTHTFLFAASSANQDTSTATAVGFPASEWGFINPGRDPADSRFPEAADYEMDPTVVNDSRHDIEASLRAIPTISLSMPSDHFFKESTVATHGTDPSEGIYVNPGGLWPGGRDRDDWERAASFEYIPAHGNPNGATDTQEDCGLRMQGLSSTVPGTYRKFSFRAAFRREYGASKLEHDVFPSEPDAVNRHNSLVLRAGSSDKWDHALTDPVFGIDSVQYIRDSFVRQSQLAAEGLTAHSDWVHVYLNGVYWGLYNMIERTDRSWNAEYRGGDESDYQIENDASSSSFSADIENTPLWNNLTTQLRDAGTILDQDDYINAAATLEMGAFAEYMMINQLALNSDWPGANYSLSAPLDPSRGGWLFTAEGADQTLTPDPGNERAWMSFRRSRFVLADPGTFWDNLRPNPHFREIFADLLQKHMIAPGGAFTVPMLQARYQADMDLVRLPLEAESARWGDAQGPLKTPIDDWEPLATSTRDQYLADIVPTFLSLYQEYGLVASIPAPTISPAGGQLQTSDPLTLTGPVDSTIYYTTDGSDPKSPLDYNRTIALDASAPWRLLRTDVEPANWSTPGFNDSSWTAGDGEITSTFIENGFEYVRFELNIPDQASLDAIHSIVITAAQRYNILTFYVNGVEITTEIGAINASNPKVLARSLIAGVPELVVGQNILGMRFQQNGPSTAPVFNGTFTLGALSLFNHNPGSNQPVGNAYSTPIPAFSGLSNLKARARDNVTGRWSALTEGSFETGLFQSGLVISEFNYRPHSPVIAAETAISTDRDDYEFIEFMNTGNSALDLTGYHFTDGVTFTFPDGTIIGAGDRVLIVSNQAAFTARYGVALAPIIGEYEGNLSNSGERIAVNSPEAPIIDFTYADEAPWPESADGDGPSLVLIAPGSNSDPADQNNWRLSSAEGGTPGSSNTSSLAAWMAFYSITDLTEDDDNDGTPNLVEFATGTNPTTFSQPALESLIFDTSDVASLSVRIELASLDEVRVFVERSTDLSNWGSDGVDYVGESYNGDGTISADYSSELDSEERFFFRIRVESLR